MQYTLRGKFSASSAPESAPRITISDPMSCQATESSKSLTKKVSRSFTLSKSRKTTTTTTAGGLRTSLPLLSSAKSVHSDSDSTSSRSSPSSPQSTSAQGGFYVRSASPTSSVSTSSTIKDARAGGRLSRQQSTDSFMSVYQHGYGSGHYAVNLEEIYLKQEEDPTEESLFVEKGLQRFSVQEYLAIL